MSEYYDDPVRYELSQQINTLLRANSSILESVDTKKYKIKSMAKTTALSNNSAYGLERLTSSTPNLHYHQSAVEEDYPLSYPQHQQLQQQRLYSSSSSVVKPYDALVQADAEAATYIFQDRPLTNERERRERPPSASTISRVAKHMTMEQKHQNASASIAPHVRQHLADRHKRDASVATTTGIRPNALFEHFEKARRASNLRLKAKIRREEKLRSLNISLNLSSGVSMIRKQTLDERRENNRRMVEQNIKKSVNKLKIKRKDVKHKMKTSFALQKKDSLDLFKQRRQLRRSTIKRNNEIQEVKLKKTKIIDSIFTENISSRS